jgi:hypothetical protein
MLSGRPPEPCAASGLAEKVPISVTMAGIAIPRRIGWLHEEERKRRRIIE